METPQSPAPAESTIPEFLTRFIRNLSAPDAEHLHGRSARDRERRCVMRAFLAVLWRVLTRSVYCADCQHLNRCADGSIPDYPLCRVRPYVDPVTGAARPDSVRVINAGRDCRRFRPLANGGGQ